MAIILLASALTADAAVFTIDLSEPRQTIRHFGASDAWSMQFIGCWQDEASSAR